MFSIFKLEDGESHLEIFDRKRKPMKSVIKEYRELSMELELDPGRYMVVPSCKKAGEYGRFYLSIYFSEGEEDQNSTGFTHFKARYVNPYDGEEDQLIFGDTIAEEDEDLNRFDEEFKRLL